jgi:hypothetical protein
MTLAGSKINDFRFYNREKSENLHSCYLLCWLYHSKAEGHNVNNGLDTKPNN